MSHSDRGRLFHALGPATEKALEPMMVTAIGKKRRVLRKSGPVTGLLAYWPSRLKALVAMGPAIRPTLCRLQA